ncbi:transcriptional repressor [Tessaracoccus lapidicaptus]|uniref:Transcriptional repressor n=1 Tax=Tessaracoccus lapidicaptus TaxID=1427523 RepID=A0A1C0AK74_9ACTN|nr:MULTISPECIES: transcriptional repressor [Tessaracoccus]AQX16925.1 transcriptional repressor [Tessaracoccus sp. T2.5-30]OCL33015.1 transcriptional repressor [Tessaracoccus lapidicaptus]VEP41735.1 Zinc uptake regulation protein [Tessaracoccus lapidicaptus]
MTSTRTGARNTWQRAAIRDLLEGCEEFRTAQQLHDQLRESGAKVGLATVYRALQAMTEAGEVDMLRSADGEATYRRCSSSHHHHLVCRECGYSVEIVARPVEEWAAEVAASNGFTEVGHEVEVFGLCRACSGRDD